MTVDPEAREALSYVHEVPDRCDRITWRGRYYGPPPLEPHPNAVVVQTDPVLFAVERWNAEVKNRPLVNIHRRTLDDAWRQVMRRFGGDPDALVGPSHDELLDTARD